jgi:hypothetical protein
MASWSRISSKREIKDGQVLERATTQGNCGTEQRRTGARDTMPNDTRSKKSSRGSEFNVRCRPAKPLPDVFGIAKSNVLQPSRLEQHMIEVFLGKIIRTSLQTEYRLMRELVIDKFPSSINQQ